MISDLCDRGECETCFEDELDACGHECHPTDCPAVESTGDGRAQDPAAEHLPPVARRADRSASPGLSGGPAVPIAPHGTAGGKTPARTGTASGTVRAGTRSSAEPDEGGRGGGSRPGRGEPAFLPPRPGQDALSPGQMAIARAMSEAGLEKVQELCEGFGILRFHNPDSRRVREKGLPDDILIGARGVLWRELKNMKRKLTPEQEKVGEQLTAHGQDWAVWRPTDLLSRRIEFELRAISGLRVAGGVA